MSGKYARLCVILAVLMVLIPAYCANARELSFLQENPELKARLLRWEQEAPEEVKSEIVELRSFCRVYRESLPSALPALLDNSRSYVFGVSLSPLKTGTVDKAATLALIEADDDKTAWEVWSEGPTLKTPSLETVTLSELACFGLARIGDPAIEPLGAALTDKDEQVRRHAARALGALANRKNHEAVVAGLEAYKSALAEGRDKDFAAAEQNRNKQEVRKEITMYAVDPLIAALEDEDSSVKKVVAESLLEGYRPMIPDKRWIKTFIDALKDTDPSIREIAVRAVGEVRDGRPNEALIACFRDESDDVRRAAASAFNDGIYYRRKNNQDMVMPLITLLNDKDWLARETALYLLRSNSFSGSPTFKSLITPLEDSQNLSEEAQREKIRMLRSLISWLAYGSPVDEGTREAISKIQAEDQSALGLASLLVRRGYPFEQLEQRDNFARSKAAELLGAIRDKRPVDSLIAAMKDESSTIRTSALEALKQITGKDYGEDYDQWLQWWKEQNRAGG